MTPPQAPVGRLVVCPDADRQPRRTSRCACSRRSPRPTSIACEDTRHTRVLLDRHGIARALWSATTSTTNAPARARAARRGSRGGRGRRARQRRRHAARLRPRLRAACGRASRRGCRSRCCPGRAPSVTALVASGLPAARWCFVGLPAARARASSSALLARRARDARRLRVAAPPRRRRSRCSPTRDPQRPVAVCRELTKLHEEVARGSAARAGRRTTARDPPRGEVVLVLRRRAAAAPRARAGARGAARADRGRRPAAAGGRRASAALTGVARQRALPRR